MATREIARLEETVSMSGAGVVTACMLALFNLGALMFYFASASSAFQEAAIGAFWTAGNVLLGVCMLCGLRRNYRVVRDEPDEPK